MVRGKHTIGRAFSLLFLSLVLFGAILLFHFILGYPDHDPILVMRLLRPVVVRKVTVSEYWPKIGCLL